MEEIKRGKGTTADERYLFQIAERSFLNLWSYPNIYFDKKQHGRGDGKEVCDLLVVCGNDVIIFSDKGAGWPPTPDLPLAWSRWYRTAVTSALVQLRGASRILDVYAEGLYLDPACTQRLPISIPPASKRTLHFVITAFGAQDACANYFGNSHGAFRPEPQLRGIDHVNIDHPGYRPFHIGDVNPDDRFCHVFDRSSLEILLLELSTVSDFTTYLTFRAKAMRSGRLSYVAAEKDLCAVYLESVGEASMRPIANADGSFIESSDDIAIRTDAYEAFVASDLYQSKHENDQDSYAWDQLINVFSTNVIAGTAVSVFDQDASFSTAERVLREMVMEPRNKRRVLGHSWLDFLQLVERLPIDQRARMVLPPVEATGRKVAYIFLSLDHPPFELERGYQQYREVRVTVLRTYCTAVLHDRKDIDFAIAIGFDAGYNPNVPTRSEEVVGMEQPEWTVELLDWMKKSRRLHKVLLGGHKETSVINSAFEPLSFTDTTPLSRQQRRAAERAARKANR